MLRVPYGTRCIRKILPYIAHRPEGLVAAGTPLGSDAFVETNARSRAETVASLVTALASLPLGNILPYVHIHCHTACLVPRVWVWGVWFGFALRCMALLCGVFVRLHLALFPASGPFLPSHASHVHCRMCAVSPSPRLRLFKPVSRPVCGFGVSGSASLCVA
jgi:hypothetical protein